MAEVEELGVRNLALIEFIEGGADAGVGAILRPRRWVHAESKVFLEIWVFHRNLESV